MQRALVLSAVGFGALWVSDLHALQRTPEPCDRYATAVRANANDREAAVALGQCTVRDESMIAPDGDSTRLRFRTEWTPALRALRGVVDADPAYDRAYRLLFRMLLSETRDGCSYTTGECRHVASVRRDGDTIVTTPRLVVHDTSGNSAYDPVVRETEANWRPSLIETRTRAERWASVAPDDRRPHEYIGRAALRLGDVGQAADALEHAAALGTPASRRALFWERIEALIKADRGVDARRVLDEAAADPERDTVRLRSMTLANLNAVVGRQRLPPVDSARVRRDSIRFDSLRRSRPALVRPALTRPPEQRGVEELIAAGDTAAAKRAIAHMDSMMAPPPGQMRLGGIGSQHLASARYHLLVADTAGAEARLAEVDRVIGSRRYEFNWNLIFGDPRPWMGNAWSLAGDVAAARGRPADAAQSYRRVVGLWGGGDANLQPVVAHARERLNALPRR